MDEKIIDLVEVVKEGKPLPAQVQETPTEKITWPDLTPEWQAKIAELVREEVDRLVRSSVEENLEQWTREVLAEQVEKALTREIEALKSVPA
jgi:hypothetical protein